MGAGLIESGAKLGCAAASLVLHSSSLTTDNGGHCPRHEWLGATIHLCLTAPEEMSLHLYICRPLATPRIRPAL